MIQFDITSACLYSTFEEEINMDIQIVTNMNSKEADANQHYTCYEYELQVYEYMYYRWNKEYDLTLKEADANQRGKQK